MARKKNQDIIKGMGNIVMPRIAHSNPKNAALSDIQNGMNKNADAGGVFFSTPTPYQPEFGDPSKINFPIDRHQQNRYWRMFYRLDPVVGSVIDMFAEMLSSDIDIYGEGITGDIKRAYEDAISETRIVSLFQYFVKEFLVVGEIIPHLIFDESRGIWTDLLFHNPDQVNVLSSPFVSMQPILEFVPDEGLRKFVTSQHPQVLDYIQSLPPEVVSAIASGQNVPLNTKFNASFIARKLFPYDVRGTSIMPRMWQISMYESAVYNSAIATARRHCFVAGTSVMMSDGIKNIEDIKVGDKVITGEGNIKEVVDAWEEPAGGNLIEIKALGSEAFTCTENHKFKIWKQSKYCKCGCGETTTIKSSYISGHHCKRDPKTGRFNQKSIEWDNFSVGARVIKGEDPIKVVEAKDIEKGDYFLIPRKFEEKPTDISKEQARLLGYYLAEGGLKATNKYKTVCFYFGGHEHTTIALEAYEYCKMLGLSPSHKLKFKKNDETRKIGEPNVYLYLVEDNWFTEWCTKHGGNRCTNKQLSEEIMQWPLYLKEELVKGYFRGDGHLNTKLQQVCAASVSKTLIYQMKIILAQLGIFGAIYKNKKQNPKWNDCYFLTSNGGDARKLAKLIWDKDIEFTKTSRLRTFMDENYIYAPVQKTKKLDCKTKTYNLTIKDDHSYIVECLSSLNSGPLKICKLGSPEHQFIPPKEFFDEIVQQFTLAESDPHAMIVLPNYGIQFEAFGTTDRMMSISREYDIIERVKLTAMGVSQGMIHGSATLASSKTNLDTMLMRLKGMRKFFEDGWYLPRFFKPLAEINEWHHRSKAQVDHRIRIKKTASEQRLIVPKIKWRQLLEPVVDKDMLDAIRMLNELGVKSSKTTSFAAAGLDFEGETVNALTEQKIEKALRKRILPEEAKKKGPEDIASEILPGGAMPLSPDELPMTPKEEVPGAEAAPSGGNPGGAASAAETVTEGAPAAPPITPASRRGFKITANDVEDLVDLMETGKTDSEVWAYIFDKEEDPKEFTKNCTWDRVCDYLEDEHYSNDEIEYVRKSLVRKRIIEPTLNDKLEEAVETLNFAAASDGELHKRIDDTIGKIFKDKIANIQTKVKEQEDGFLTGEGNLYTGKDFVVRSGVSLTDKDIKRYRKKK